MSMNISQNYGQFYKGTEALQSYGSGSELIKKKDTLVKYEFNTVDEKGNKVAEPMSKEEALKAMKEISSQYGDNVIVEFSGDGLAALAQSLKEQVTKGKPRELSEEEKAAQALRNEEFQKQIVQLENTHRIFIPNVPTNEKFYGSLENADEKIVKAANGIITNYLMPSNVAGMTEAERQDMIAFGLEEARYLAENYLDEEHAKDFLSAMETVAKYGMSGTVDKDGKVNYNIDIGPIIGSSDEQARARAVLKEKAPDLYEELEAFWQDITSGNPTGKWGKRYLELVNEAERVLDAAGARIPDYNERAANYKVWEAEMNKTELPKTYQGVKYDGIAAFWESLKGQGSLAGTWLDNAMSRFMKWLEI